MYNSCVPFDPRFGGRDGCYGLSRLVDSRGRDGKLTEWLDELTAEKIAQSMNVPVSAIAEGALSPPEPIRLAFSISQMPAYGLR